MCQYCLAVDILWHSCLAIVYDSTWKGDFAQICNGGIKSFWHVILPFVWEPVEKNIQKPVCDILCYAHSILWNLFLCSQQPGGKSYRYYLCLPVFLLTFILTKIETLGSPLHSVCNLSALWFEFVLSQLALFEVYCFGICGLPFSFGWLFSGESVFLLLWSLRKWDTVLAAGDVCLGACANIVLQSCTSGLHFKEEGTMNIV